MMETYNVVIRTDGRSALTDTELARAIVEAINRKDDEAERYGAPLAGYMLEINNRRMF